MRMTVDMHFNVPTCIIITLMYFTLFLYYIKHWSSRGPTDKAWHYECWDCEFESRRECKWKTMPHWRNWIARLASNQKVLGSNPRWGGLFWVAFGLDSKVLKKWFFYYLTGQIWTADLGISAQTPNCIHITVPRSTSWATVREMLILLRFYRDLNSDCWIQSPKW